MPALFHFLRDWRENRRLDHEIDSIPEADLAAMGINREDFRRVAHMPAEQVARMEQMAEKFGATEALKQAGWVAIEVANRCAHCGENGNCKRKMAANVSVAEIDFCPNADTYRELAS